MITINKKYIEEGIDFDLLCESLENYGHTVCFIEDVDYMYEDDQQRKHKQNLSPHDWETEAEYKDMQYVLRKLTPVQGLL